MAEYEEMVASAADYDSDDSGADTDEEVTNGTATYDGVHSVRFT